MFKLICLESDRIYIGKIVLDLNLLYAEAEHTFIPRLGPIMYKV